MVYRLVRVYKQNNRQNRYEISDNNGKIYDVDSNRIREIFNKGHIVDGLKLSKDKRVLVVSTDYVDKSKSIKNTELNGVRCIRPGEFMMLHNKCRMYTGERLENYIQSALRYKHRDMVSKLEDDIRKDNLGILNVLYGVRRTGKTTAIYHVIQDMIKKGIDSKNILYVIIRDETDGMGDLFYTLQNTKQYYIFIDEITNFTDFYLEARPFSDSLANQKKVILTGTDSYKFHLASYDILQGRMSYVHSTLNSYREYKRVMGGNMYSYMKSGGTYVPQHLENIYNIYTEIMAPLAYNIAHSITEISKNTLREEFNRKEIQELRKLSKEELVYLVFNTILHITRVGTTNSFLKDRQRFNEEVRDIFSTYIILNTNINLSNSIINEIPIKAYDSVLSILMAMDVVKALPNIALGKEVKKESDLEFICTLQGAANTLVDITYNDSRSMGTSFENMILLQCIIWRDERTRQDFSQGKTIGILVGYARYMYEGNSYEVDCIVGYGQIISAIEIKSTNKTNTRHLRSLKDVSLSKAIKRNIKNRYVVYSGSTTVFEGIQYINAEEFMMDIGKWVTK